MKEIDEFTAETSQLATAIGFSEESVAYVEGELLKCIGGLPPHITVKQLAAFLGVSLSSAYNLVEDPKFPRKKLGSSTIKIIPRADFIKWYLSLKN